MAHQRITPETAAGFIGAQVRFNYGPMHGSEVGWVVGHETGRWGTQLLAMTGEGKLRSISGFTDIGIGVYLLGAVVTA